MLRARRRSRASVDLATGTAQLSCDRLRRFRPGLRVEGDRARFECGSHQGGSPTDVRLDHRSVISGAISSGSHRAETSECRVEPHPRIVQRAGLLPAELAPLDACEQDGVLVRQLRACGGQRGDPGTVLGHAAMSRCGQCGVFEAEQRVEHAGVAAHRRAAIRFRQATHRAEAIERSVDTVPGRGDRALGQFRLVDGRSQPLDCPVHPGSCRRAGSATDSAALGCHSRLSELRGLLETSKAFVGRCGRVVRGAPGEQHRRDGHQQHERHGHGSDKLACQPELSPPTGGCGRGGEGFRHRCRPRNLTRMPQGACWSADTGTPATAHRSSMRPAGPHLIGNLLVVAPHPDCPRTARTSTGDPSRTPSAPNVPNLNSAPQVKHSFFHRQVTLLTHRRLVATAT